MRVLVLLACLAAAVCAEKARFDNYEVHRVIPDNKYQLKVLQELQEYPDELSFWGDVRGVGRAVDIMVPPHKKAAFEKLLRDFHMPHSLFIDNVQQKIDNENPSTGQKAMGWTEYHRLDDIYTWLDTLAAEYPQVTVVTAGVSYEGRNLQGVQIIYDSANPGVFLEGGIHAREWISPATVTFMLNELLTSTDANVRAIVESYNWYIVPSVNPDGYEYTHTDNRMWRKTRSPNTGDSACNGTDPNRNWATPTWGDPIGSSHLPCGATYCGSAAFSEVEMRTLSQYIESLVTAGSIDVYLNFHSYSQVLLIPYGHTNEPVPNYDLLYNIGTKAMAILSERYGTQYEVGNVVDLMYACTGLSMDWVYGVLGVPIAYSYELRDQGQFGFLLPAEQIIPTGEETFDSVLSIISDASVWGRLKNKSK